MTPTPLVPAAALGSRPVTGTGLRLTELSFGAASIGNLHVEMTEADAAATVAQAWDSGIRYFDTAPHYGLGLSERRLGAALAGYPRHELVLSSKVGRLVVRNQNPTDRDTEGFAVSGSLGRAWDFSRAGVLRSVEDSLDRLSTDYLDILYLHDPEVSGIDDAMTTGAAALIELRDQGVVKAVGVGSTSAPTVARALRELDIDTAMLAGRYTLLERDRASEVFAAAAARSIVVASPFNSGLLARPRPDAHSRYDYAPAPAAVLDEAHRLADLAERYGSTLPQIALAFPLRHAQVASVTVGMASVAEVVANVAHYERQAPDALWRSLGLPPG